MKLSPTTALCTMLIAAVGCGGSEVPADGPTETAVAPEDEAGIESMRERAIQRSNEGKPLTP